MPKDEHAVASETLQVADAFSVGPDYFIERDGIRYAGGHLLLDMWGARHLTDPKVIESILSPGSRSLGGDDPACTFSPVRRGRWRLRRAGAGRVAHQHSHLAGTGLRRHRHFHVRRLRSVEGRSRAGGGLQACRIQTRRAPARSHHLIWFEETLHSETIDVGYAQRFRITKVIHQKKTDFQDLMIFETPAFGKVLALDGVIQTTDGDEFIYHEMITHVPMLAHGDAKRMLIVGGGDGGVLREVLRYPVDRVVTVEIDGGVVQACKAHMPNISAGAFDDPRAELLIADGIKFAAETNESFDVIIVDSTDPVGPGEVLFTDGFYADCKRIMNPGAILITQSGVPYLQGSEVTDGYNRLKPHSPTSTSSLLPCPPTPGGFMTLGWGVRRSQAARPTAGRHRRAIRRRRPEDPILHAGKCTWRRSRCRRSSRG